MMLSGLLTLIGLMGFTVLGALVGLRCLSWLRCPIGEAEHPLVSLWALGLGWGVISLGLLGLGTVHLFAPTAFLGGLGVLVVLSASCWPLLWEHGQRSGRALSRSWRQSRGVERWALRLVAFHWVISGLAVWAPPTYWDALVYHIGLPQLFLQHQQVVGISGGQIFASGPMGLEMLYSIGLGWGSDLWPGALHWWLGVLGGITLWLMAAQGWSAPAGRWAVVLWVCTPLVNMLSAGAYVEFGLAWYLLLAVSVLGQWHADRRAQWLVLAGLFAGCAANTKATGASFVGVLAVWAGAAAWAQLRRLRVSCRALLLVGACGVAVAMPWWIKSWMEYGTPGYVVDAMRTVGYTYPRWMTDVGTLLSAPWRLIMQPAFADGWPFSPGPWLWMVVPLLYFAPRPLDRRLLWLLGVAGSLLVAGTVNSVFVNRFYLPVYALVALVSGVILASARRWWGTTLARVLGGSVVCFAVLTGGMLTAQHLRRAPVVLGLESRDVYLTRRINSYPVMVYASQQLPPAARVCMFDPRVAYLGRDYVVGHPSYQVWLPLRERLTVDDVLGRLRTAGVTHLVINWPYTQGQLEHGPALDQRWWAAFVQLWDAGLQRACQPVYEAGGTVLYRVAGEAT